MNNLDIHNNDEITRIKERLRITAQKTTATNANLRKDGAHLTPNPLQDISNANIESNRHIMENNNLLSFSTNVTLNDLQHFADQNDGFNMNIIANNNRIQFSTNVPPTNLQNFPAQNIGSNPNFRHGRDKRMLDILARRFLKK